MLLGLLLDFEVAAVAVGYLLLLLLLKLLFETVVVVGIWPISYHLPFICTTECYVILIKMLVYNISLWFLVALTFSCCACWEDDVRLIQVSLIYNAG